MLNLYELVHDLSVNIELQMISHNICICMLFLLKIKYNTLTKLQQKTPIWLSSCSFLDEDRVNNFSQYLHLKGLSPRFFECFTDIFSSFRVYRNKCDNKTRNNKREKLFV